jgi:hypothetical protein
VKDSNPVALDPEDDLKERVASLGNDFAIFADKLGTNVKVTTAFPEPPPEFVHIIVRRPIVLPEPGKQVSPNFYAIPNDVVFFMLFFASRSFLTRYLAFAAIVLILHISLPFDRSRAFALHFPPFSSVYSFSLLLLFTAMLPTSPSLLTHHSRMISFTLLRL